MVVVDVFFKAYEIVYMLGIMYFSKNVQSICQVLPNILSRSQFGGMTVEKGCCMYVCPFWSGQRPVHFLLAYFQGKSSLLSRSFHPWAILPPSVRLSQRTLLHTVWNDIIKSVNFFKILYLDLVEHFLVYRRLPINLGPIGISMIVVILLSISEEADFH